MDSKLNNIPERRYLAASSRARAVKNKLRIMHGFVKKAINENAGELLSTGQLRLPTKKITLEAVKTSKVTPRFNPKTGNFRPTGHAHRRRVEAYLSFSDSCLISSERKEKEKWKNYI